MSDPTIQPSDAAPPPGDFAARPRLAELLAQDVTPQVESAARQLIATGDALLVRHARNAIHGFVLDHDHYETRLEWNASEFNAICACQTRTAGFICPHLWATVLLADRSGAFRPLEEARTHPIFQRNAETRNAPASANAWPMRAGWKIHLASLALAQTPRPGEEIAAVPGLPRQVIYVIDAPETRAARGAVILELHSRYHKKARLRNAGGWSRSAALRLDSGDIDTFTDPEDRDILARIVGARNDDLPANGSASHAPGNGSPNGAAPAAAPRLFALRGTVGLDLLRRMCQTGRCRLRLAAATSALVPPDLLSLAWDDGPPYEFLVRIAPHDDGRHYTLTGHLQRDDRCLPLSAAHLLAEPAPGQPGLAFIDGRVARAQLAGGVQWMDLLSSRGPLHVPRSDVHEFLRQVAALPAVPRFDLPEELRFEQFIGVPQPRLVLRAPVRAAYGPRPDERVSADVLFDYESGPVDALAAAAGAYDPVIKKMTLRNRLAEAQALAVLKGLGFRLTPDPDTGDRSYDLHPRLLPAAIPALIREGWRVEAEGRLYRAATDVRVSVSSGIDWFDLSGSVRYGDQVVPLPRLLAAARKGEHLVKLADGTFGVLPEEWLARFGVIVQSGAAVKDESGAEAIRFSRAQAGLLDVLLESQPQASIDPTFQALRNQLRSFTGIAPLDPPSEFVGQLRPYQREGLGWFAFLRQFAFGGCLADDMGLGKTIQVLALLLSRRGATRSPLAPRKSREMEHRPSLIVAPRSLVFNWLQEAARFAPRLRILDHTGPNRARATEHFADYDAVLTTYGTLRSDIPFLREYRFDYAILDEAQAIKNAQTESAKAVRLLQADHRLALSGTPVQNHLGELWSLFEFLNPGMLGAASVFEARLVPSRLPRQVGEAPAPAEEAPNGSDDDDPDDSPRLVLGRALRPFILRRTKEQVAQDLPPCTEQTILCELDDAQRALYDELRLHYRQVLLGDAGRTLAPANRIQVLEALLRLRQAACHPGLIDKTRSAESSSKLDTLLTQIDEILEEGHKALIFSQFTSLLAIVRQRFDERHIRYAYLDGKTRDRKSPVEQFQNDPATPLFLISLKAGGLGLNLTGADYVFLLDPWWNPAVEAQAIDRAHRIGQTRHVFAYRIIARDTVEEKVLQLQQTKRDLADAIISEDNAVLSNLTAEDLQVLLS